MQRRFEAPFGEKASRRWLYFWIRVKRVALFWRDASELDGALTRLAPVGLIRVLPDDRARQPDFQKCIACSLCTFSCKAVRDGTAPPSFEPKQLAIAYGKSLLAGSSIPAAWVPCASCDRCTVACPNDVPLHAIASSLMGNSRPVAPITSGTTAESPSEVPSSSPPRST